MVKKRWNKENMKIRLENLKKIISPAIVDAYLVNASFVTNNHLDAMYIAYYNLKKQFLKYKTNVFHINETVEYEHKTNLYKTYADYVNYYYPKITDNVIDGYNSIFDTSGTFSTSTYTTTASNYCYNLYANEN